VSFGEFASPLSVLCNHCFTHLQRSSQQNARLLNERASPRLAGREEGAKARRRQAARWTPREKQERHENESGCLPEADLRGVAKPERAEEAQQKNAIHGKIHCGSTVP
jgi:hypothetical protein